MTRGSSKTFASSEPRGARRQAWLVTLLIYVIAAGGDFAYHLADDLRTGDRMIEYSEVAVSFSAALFWPVDAIAMVFLAAH